jgi:hypothetical protein
MCRHIYVLGVVYKSHNFKITYVRGVLIVHDKIQGHARFLTVARLLDAMDRAIGGSYIGTGQAIGYVIADVWRSEDADSYEIRFNVNGYDSQMEKQLWLKLRKVTFDQKLELGAITHKLQAIALVPKNKLNALKLGFLTLDLNPVYEWRNFTV